MTYSIRARLLAGCAFLLAASAAQAHVTKLEILRIEPAFGGAAFGETGAYERVVGRVLGELDPNAPANTIIQDIGLAPRNAHGMVEYTTDLDLIRPANPAKSNNVLLFDVMNRGNKRALTLFNADMKGSAAALNIYYRATIACWPNCPWPRTKMARR